MWFNVFYPATVQAVSLLAIERRINMSACAPAGDRIGFRDSLRARCEVNGNGRDCKILNLTSKRVFVDSFVPALTGSNVTLRFRLPNGHQVSAAGVVSDHKFQVGFSVDFVELSAQDRDQINGLIAR
jgi:hypothetical protein